MSGHPNGRPRTKEPVAILFLLTLILTSVVAVPVESSSVAVSPGKHDLLLGDTFPTFDSVILSYPDSAILTNTSGDLLFNVTLGLNSTQFCQSLSVHTPHCKKTPPISKSFRSSVNIYIPPDFSGIATSNLWTSYTNNYDPNRLRVSRASSADQVGPNWWEVTVFNLFLTGNPDQVNPENGTFLANQTQYIRLFQVTSPTTAGRYFFKALINGTSIGAQNFPTIVVKASRDPAYISGVLRDSGDRNASRAGKPIILPEGAGAHVLATGLDYLGRSVSAQTFINSTAGGKYTLFGVAPGTYNITAYAAGYEPATRPWTVTVAVAQSLEGVDVYLSESVNITGAVLSENAQGNLIPWGTLAGVTINGIQNVVPRAITVDLLNLKNGTVGSLAASTPAPYRITTFTNPTSTEFDFSIQNEVGFDGRIPQEFANYTSGLVFGDYLLQAYVTSYIQLDEVRVHVDNETTSTFSTIPLIRTGEFNVTVHFKNSQNGTLVDSPINACSRCTLTVSAYDMEGILRAQNVTFVPYGAKSWNITLQGFSSSRGFGFSYLFPSNYGLLPGTYYITASITSAPSISGNANLGIATLYYQTSSVLATIGLGEGVVDVSFPLYKAGGILLNLYSINYQVPPIVQPWSFPRTPINFNFNPTFSLQKIFQTNTTQPAGVYNKTITIIGFQTGGYDVVIQT
ncbi:MAG TPA: carboxypeptidase-like regulatory domain-containing protein, partial [Candidatus Acidoferrales bacterium]|nr:carboxypeptidase-like regulatory domain-containing protein [Candidatus Acidoferrales bacterium]